MGSTPTGPWLEPRGGAGITVAGIAAAAIDATELDAAPGPGTTRSGAGAGAPRRPRVSPPATLANSRSTSGAFIRWRGFLRSRPIST